MITASILLLSCIFIAINSLSFGVSAASGVFWDQVKARGGTWPFDGEPPNFWRRCAHAMAWLAGLWIILIFALSDVIQCCP
jgi:hypothetical protein